MPDVLESIVAQIPDEWLKASANGTQFSIEEMRKLYVSFLVGRLESSNVFIEEALRAQQRPL